MYSYNCFKFLTSFLAKKKIILKSWLFSYCSERKTYVYTLTSNRHSYSVVFCVFRKILYAHHKSSCREWNEDGTEWETWKDSVFFFGLGWKDFISKVFWDDKHEATEKIIEILSFGCACVAEKIWLETMKIVGMWKLSNMENFKLFL